MDILSSPCPLEYRPSPRGAVPTAAAFSPSASTPSTVSGKVSQDSRASAPIALEIARQVGPNAAVPPSKHGVVRAHTSRHAPYNRKPSQAYYHDSWLLAELDGSLHEVLCLLFCVPRPIRVLEISATVFVKNNATNLIVNKT